MNTPRTPNPILAALGGLLESALNRAIALDADTAARIRALDGRALTVDFSNTPFALRLAVDGERLRVGPAFEGASALRVAATPGALLAMALRRGDDGAAPGKVEIAGDADLARRLEKIASGFAPDFEEAFARAFGDTLGVPLAQGFARALAFARERGEALVQDTADYLRDESRDAVAPGEMEAFLDDVDALRERGERLEARVARLAALAERRA
ncbi:ubiquinone biosynthesis accessory factor UbiJ [Tahibacter soli]|uniref:Ubiquinone biosynthesis accessory factor UbiJ n=1 Tax=Tahibacter soli TaxID=2983605 RepID=A0A9X3YN92_9GAMM|nr:SCP2 sterol-binding domain-containing protein [Tahibacter soli]MDC8014335.1 SCP2 sterol-binding domain-containing protein [Tahibacter soli]